MRTKHRLIQHTWILHPPGWYYGSITHKNTHVTTQLYFSIQQMTYTVVLLVTYIAYQSVRSIARNVFTFSTSRCINRGELQILIILQIARVANNQPSPCRQAMHLQARTSKPVCLHFTQNRPTLGELPDVQFLETWSCDPCPMRTYYSIL